MRRSSRRVGKNQERVIPAMNETTESEIGDDIGGMKDLSSGRTGIVA